MEVLGILGFVFAATSTGVLVYEHQMDVLHGPYIEGRQEARYIPAMFEQVRPVVAAVIERITWKARNAIYLASLA